MSIQQIPGLYYGPSARHGRGIFCARDIAAGDVVEIAPVIVFPDLDPEELRETSFYQYYFLWGSPATQVAIALGYGALYNHSEYPNLETIQDLAERTVVFTACRDIMSGEELTIDYREGLDGEPLWFDPSN